MMRTIEITRTIELSEENTISDVYKWVLAFAKGSHALGKGWAPRHLLALADLYENNTRRSGFGIAYGTPQEVMTVLGAANHAAHLENGFADAVTPAPAPIDFYGDMEEVSMTYGYGRSCLSLLYEQVLQKRRAVFKFEVQLADDEMEQELGAIALVHKYWSSRAWPGLYLGLLPDFKVQEALKEGVIEVKDKIIPSR